MWRYLESIAEAVAPLPQDALWRLERVHWRAIREFYLDWQQHHHDTPDGQRNDEVEAEVQEAFFEAEIPVHLVALADILVDEERAINSKESSLQSSDRPVCLGPCAEFALGEHVIGLLCQMVVADLPRGVNIRHFVLPVLTHMLGDVPHSLLPHMSVHKPVRNLVMRLAEATTVARGGSQRHRVLVSDSSKVASADSAESTAPRDSGTSGVDQITHVAPLTSSDRPEYAALVLTLVKLLSADKFLVNFFFEIGDKELCDDSRSLEGVEFALLHPLQLIANDDGRAGIAAREGILAVLRMEDDVLERFLRTEEQSQLVTSAIGDLCSRFHTLQSSLNWQRVADIDVEAQPVREWLNHIVFVNDLVFECTSLRSDDKPRFLDVAQSIVESFEDSFIDDLVSPVLMHPASATIDAETVARIATCTIALSEAVPIIAATGSAKKPLLADIQAGAQVIDSDDDSDKEQQELLGVVLDSLLGDFDNIPETPDQTDSHSLRQTLLARIIAGGSVDAPSVSVAAQLRDEFLSVATLRLIDALVTTRHPRVLHNMFLRSATATQLYLDSETRWQQFAFADRVQAMAADLLTLFPSGDDTTQGYDAYLQDALSCVDQHAKSMKSRWPAELEAVRAQIDDLAARRIAPPVDGGVAYSCGGPWLAALLDKLRNASQLGTDELLLISGLLKSLSQTPFQELVTLLLASPEPGTVAVTISAAWLRPDTRTLWRVLHEVAHDVEERLEVLPNRDQKLKAARASVAAGEPLPDPHGSQQRFLVAAIILGEFCKEISATTAAWVKRGCPG